MKSCKSLTITAMAVLALSGGNFVFAGTPVNAPMQEHHWNWVESKAPYYVIPGCNPINDYPCRVDQDGNFNTRDIDQDGFGQKALEAALRSGAKPQVHVDVYVAKDTAVLNFVPYQLKNYGMGSHLNDTESNVIVFKMKNPLNPFEEGKTFEATNAEEAIFGGNYSAHLISAATPAYVANLNADVSSSARLSANAKKVFDSAQRVVQYIENQSAPRVVFYREAGNHRIVPVTNWEGLKSFDIASTHILIPPGAEKLEGFENAVQISYEIIRPEFADVVRAGLSDAANVDNFMDGSRGIEVRSMEDASGQAIQTQNWRNSLVNTAGQNAEANIPAAWRPKNDPIGGNTSPESHLAHLDLWLKIFPGLVAAEDSKIVRNPYYAPLNP